MLICDISISLQIREIQTGKTDHAIQLNCVEFILLNKITIFPAQAGRLAAFDRYAGTEYVVFACFASQCR